MATGQHGIVAYWELTALGLGARAIERRAESGRLHRLSRPERLDGNALQRLIARSTGRRGLKPLRAAIDAAKGSAPWTQSELERAFLALVRDAEIAEPAANVLVAGVLVDLVWLPQRLVAEVDSYGFHRTRARFEEDRRRGAGLLVAGYRVLRVTQRRIEQEPRRVISELRALLAAA